MGHRSKSKQQAPSADPNPQSAICNLQSAIRNPQSAIRNPQSVPGWWGWAAALVGGVAGALAFDPVALRPLIVLAPLGCFLAIRWSASPRAALLRAWVFGWVYYFGALHWLLTISQWAQPQVLGILGVVLLAVYLGAYPALIGYTLRRWLWTDCASWQFALFASFWLGSEWLRTVTKLAMPLAQLGHAWATIPWAIQIAQGLGELGVSLEVLYVAGLIFLAARWLALRRAPHRAPHPRALKRLGLLVPALGALAILWGCVSVAVMKAWDRRTREALTSPAASLFNVGLVQPNIPQDLKLASENYGGDENQRIRLQQWIRERTEAMLAQWAHGQYGLILLPETAYTEVDFNLNEPLKNRVSETVRKTGADVLVSATRLVSDSEFYNTAFFVHKDGRFDKEWYDKIRLVPFGENLPYFDAIPGMRSLVGILPITEGKAQTLFTSGGYKFGVLICFESTFSSLARSLVRQGASFLTVVTNDAWYGMSAGAPNHHNLSLLRAVETRRWLLRCANTGISSIVTPAGRIASYETPRGAARATLPLGAQGFVQGTIAPGEYTGRTLFTRLGNAWLALPLLTLLAGLIRRRRLMKTA